MALWGKHPLSKRWLSSHHRLAGFLVLAASIGGGWVFAGCGLEAPKAPQFETTLNIPLSQETFTGVDMADELEAVEGDSAEAGPLSIRISEDLEPILLSDGLCFSIDGSSAHATLEEIDFGIPEIEPLAFRLEDLAPGTIPPVGFDVPVDSFSFEQTDEDLGTFDEYQQLCLAAGFLRLTLDNLLPFPIGGALEDGHAVIVIVEDRSVDPLREVARYEISEPLPAAGTRVSDCDLAGATIGNHLVLSLFGWSPGSSGAFVHISPDIGLDLALEFIDCEIAEFIGNAPSFSLETDESISLGDDLSVIEATVAAGVIQWDIRSDLPVQATIFVEFPEVFRDGNPLVLEDIIPPNGEVTLGTDLAGTAIVADGISALSCHMEVVTDSATVPCTIRLDQGISAEQQSSDIAFDYIRGVLGPIEVEIERTDVDIEFADVSDGIEFVAAEAILQLRNRTDVSLEALLELAGTAGGDTIVVGFSADIPPSTSAEPTEVRIELNETNSNILELLNLRPDEAWIGGALLVGDGVSVSEVYAEDFIDGSYTVQVPMKLVLDTAQHDGEPFDVELDESAREFVSENLREVGIEANVENHFPVAVRVCFHFARSQEALFVNDDLVLEMDEIPAAPLDPQTGRVSAADSSTVTLLIESDDIDFFANPNICGAIEVTLVGAGEDPCEIWTTDYVTIRGMAAFKCLLP
jgi:hypothetical protein